MLQDRAQIRFHKRITKTECLLVSIRGKMLTNFFAQRTDYQTLYRSEAHTDLDRTSESSSLCPKVAQALCGHQQPENIGEVPVADDVVSLTHQWSGLVSQKLLPATASKLHRIIRLQPCSIFAEAIDA